MKPPEVFGYQLPVDPGRLHRNLITSGIAILVGLMDQGPKWLTIYSLASRSEPLLLVGSWITLHLTQNSGAVLLLSGNKTLAVTILGSIVLAALTVVMFLSSNRAQTYALAVVIGGGSGNITDRHMGSIFGTGAVTDSIDYFGLFVGNVADIFAVIGMISVFRLMLKNVSIFGYATSEDSEESVKTQMIPHESEPKTALRSTLQLTPYEPAGGKNKRTEYCRYRRA